MRHETSEQRIGREDRRNLTVRSLEAECGIFPLPPNDLDDEEAAEWEAEYMDASPEERPAVLRRMMEVNPTSMDRRSFADMLACDFYTDAQLRRLEHFRDPAA